MLHRHLTVAFRALDHKWGEPVDLDTSTDTMPCIPAMVERPTTTFSSEEYLISIKRRRLTPYSREQRKVRSRKMKDSFSNISLARYNSASDLGGSTSCLDSRCPEQSSSGVTCDDLLEDMKELVQNLKKPMESFEEKTSVEVESELEKKMDAVENVFREMKNRAIMFVEKKFRKRF